MSKHLEILENFDKLSRDDLIALVGQILTTAEDVAYAYDVTEEMTERLKEDIDTEDFVTDLHKVLIEVRTECEDKTAHIDDILGRIIATRTSAYRNEKRSGILTKSREVVMRRVILAIEEYNNHLRQESITDVDEGFAYIKETFAGTVADMKAHLSQSQSMIENMFLFVEDVFDEPEMLVVVTELTVNYYSAKFISRYGCEKYFEHNKELLVYERQQELLSEIMLLNEEEEINLSI